MASSLSEAAAGSELQGVCRLSERRDSKRYRSCSSGGLRFSRTSEALYHPGNGHRPGLRPATSTRCPSWQGLRGVEVGAAGTTTFRPPFTPVTIGALAGRVIGKHFRTARRSPLHDWHLSHGGEMIEAGPWMRAWWYRWAGIDRLRVRTLKRCAWFVAQWGYRTSPPWGRLISRVRTRRISQPGIRQRICKAAGWQSSLWCHADRRWRRVG